MKDIYTERQALREYVEYIKEERRRLGEEYWNSIARLRELDTQVNEVANESPELINRLIQVIEKQNQTVDKLNEIVPKTPIEKVVKQVEVKPKIDANEIERAKERESKRSVRKGKISTTNEAAFKIANFLKEKGIPAGTKEIRKYLESEGIYYSNTSELINKAMESNKNIERVTRGYFQYRK